MPGIKGMVNAKPRKNAVRRKVWQSMRTFIRFAVPDLVRCSPPAKVNNVRKFVRRLAAHGYVAKLDNDGFVSGRAGSYQGWRLVRGFEEPIYPMRCDRCNRPLGEPCEPKGEPDE